MIEDHDDIVECLKELTSHVERHWPSGWEFSIPNDLGGENLAKVIVGFRFKVEEINFKKKLSQNRTPTDQMNVLMGLENRDDDNSRYILQEMRKLFSRNLDSK